MILNNKKIAFCFIGDFYIKEHLLYEISKIINEKNAKIISFFNNINAKDNSMIAKLNISQIEKITKNKAVLININEINHDLIVNADILILISCDSTFIYNIANNNFDNYIYKLIQLFLKEEKNVVIGINSNNNIIKDFECIKKIINRSHYFFIPLIFPNSINKPNLITFDSALLTKTIEYALDNRQIKPLISKGYI